MIFLNSASSAAALPGVCTHTDTEGKQRKTRVRNILKSLEKTQYLMNTLYISAVITRVNYLLISCGSNLEMADLNVEGKALKCHRADEGDSKNK